MALAELELSMVNAHHAFQRWIVCSTAAMRLKDLAAVDALVLHQLNHRAGNKRLADICFVLHIEDAHVVGYALRKLIGLGIVNADKHGKEVTYSITALGQEHLLQHQKIRTQCLLDSIDTLDLDHAALQELAQFLRKMSGLYDQAARAASSI